MALKPSLTKLLGFQWNNGNISKTGTQNGSVYYVDYSVTSSGDGKTIETAFKTLAEALSAVTTGKGDTIYIAPGFYLVDETQTINKSDVNIIGTGNGAEATVIFGSGSSSSPTESDYHLFTITGGNVVIKNLALFTHKNTKASIYMNGLGGGYNAGGCIIDNCIFVPQVVDGQAYGIYAEAGAMNTVKNCKFYATKTAGIYIKDATNNPIRWNIENNYFYGCGDAGIIIDAPIYETTIKDNTFQTGSSSGYNMSDDIVFTSNVTAGDVSVLGNYASTTTLTDFIADSSSGTFTYSKMNNKYTEDS